jgi:homoserine O-acetyltransferase
MKLARQIATITYRSGPEWEQRFGRRRRKAVVTSDGSGGSSLTGPGLQEADPALCPDFEIESYIDYQGEQFCLKYDANSLIYISKAMDLFDMSDEALEDLDERRTRAHGTAEESGIRGLAGSIYGEKVGDTSAPQRKHIRTLSSPSAHFYLPSLTRGLSRLSKTPTLIIGAQSDILFPIDQQRELAECLRMTGNRKVRYSELDSPTGHDSFLIDVENVGGQIKGFLS